MECTECKYRKQLALKRCKHFELGGDKKRKVSVKIKIIDTLNENYLNFEVMNKYLMYFFLIYKQGQMIQF